MDPYIFEDHSVIKIKKKRVRKGRVQNAMCVIRTNSKQHIRVTLNKVVERHMAYNTVMYPFLTSSQIRGLTLNSLGLPSFMGDIPRPSRSKRQLANPTWWTAELAINNLAMFNYSKLLRQFVYKFQLSERQSVTSSCFGRSSYANDNDNSTYQNLSNSEAHISEASSDDDVWQAPPSRVIEVTKNIKTKTRYETRNRQVVVTSIDYDEEIETSVDGVMAKANDLAMSSLVQQNKSRKRSIMSPIKNSAENIFSFSESDLFGERNLLMLRGKEEQQRKCLSDINQEITNTTVQHKSLPKSILIDEITSDFNDCDASVEVETTKFSPKEKNSAEQTPVKISSPTASKDKKLMKRNLKKKKVTKKNPVTKSKARKSLNLANNCESKTKNQESTEEQGMIVELTDHDSKKLVALNDQETGKQALTKEIQINSEISDPDNENFVAVNEQETHFEDSSDEAEDNVPMLEHYSNLTIDCASRLFTTPLLANRLLDNSPIISEENCIREDGEIDAPLEASRNIVDISFNINKKPQSLKLRLLDSYSRETSPKIVQPVETIEKQDLPLLPPIHINLSNGRKINQESKKIDEMPRKKIKLTSNVSQLKSCLTEETQSNLESDKTASCISNTEVPNDVLQSPENDFKKLGRENQDKVGLVEKVCDVVSSNDNAVDVVFQLPQKPVKMNFKVSVPKKAGKNKKSNIKVSKALSDNQTLNKPKKKTRKTKLQSFEPTAASKTDKNKEQAATVNKTSHKMVTNIKISEGKKVTQIDNIENLRSLKRTHKSSEGIRNTSSKIFNDVSKNNELIFKGATDTSSKTKKIKASVGAKVNAVNYSEVQMESDSELSNVEFPYTNNKIISREILGIPDTPNSVDSIAIRRNNLQEQLFVEATPDSSTIQSTGSSTIQISITPKTVEIVDNTEDEYADDEAYEMESLFSKKTTKSTSKFIATPKSYQSKADNNVCKLYDKKQYASTDSLNLPQINSATKVSRFLNRLGKDSTSQESYLSASTDLSISLEETDQESGVNEPFGTKSYAQSECSVRSVLANLFDPLSDAGSTHTSVAGTPTLNSGIKVMPPQKRHFQSSKKK